ncbi:hypothetical protein [Bifidobacterium avesanii]|nr:hypothetical protein [Bifidobacterium avesanii]KAB8294530.1 hypothetical protein DSM100685_0323 [Bifidobacterium avesanii]
MNRYALTFALCTTAWATCETQPLTALLFAAFALAALPWRKRTSRKGATR